MVAEENAIQSLRSELSSRTAVSIVGSGSKAELRNENSLPTLTVRPHHGIVEQFNADMVVVVRAGTLVEELQNELRKSGQCLPLPSFESGTWASGFPGTVGGAIAMSMPHILESQHSSWRDWVLGLTVMLADGTVCKCGSRAVKNVAGYDLHRFFIGSRGSLGIILEATLRIFPVNSVSKPETEIHTKNAVPNWIQRVLRTDFSAAVERAGDPLIASDPATATIWAKTEECDLPRYPGDWVIRSGCGEKNDQITDPTQIRLMKKAKDIFDPTHKLNPGEWGFM